MTTTMAMHYFPPHHQRQSK